MTLQIIGEAVLLVIAALVMALIILCLLLGFTEVWEFIMWGVI